MNKKTVALTKEQYEIIIKTIREGFLDCRPNHKVAMALVLEANLGLRVSDIVKLRLKDIVKDGTRHRLDITEQKTGKTRTFTVPKDLYIFISDYCQDHEIKKKDIIIPVTDRAIQKHLKKACDYLELKGISTHSFRKFYATNIYVYNNYNIALVQELLQHSSPTITQRYIGVGSQELEQAIQNNLNLI